MKQLLFIVLFAFLALGLNSCEQEPTTTPTPTEPVNATVSGVTYNYNLKWAKDSGGIFSFFAMDSIPTQGSNTGYYEEISISLKTNKTGTFTLSNVNYGDVFSAYLLSKTYFAYYTDSVHTGLVTLTTFDTVNHVASGTFNFVAQEQSPTKNGGDATVTNGSFTSLKW